MPERKDRLKNHIRAAREWLGKAEHSLDEDNKVKGNLNLMLAQAELQRAKESRSGHQHRVLSLAPLAVALLLAFSGYYFTASGTPTVQPPLRTAVEEHTGASLPGQAISELNTVSVAPPVAVNEQKPIVEKAAALPSVPVAAPPEPAKINAAPAAEREPAGQVPPLEMQKLMRAAGKSLRAQ